MIDFVSLVRQRHPELCDKKILALDPGDTTGVAVFQGPALVARAQTEGTYGRMWKTIDSLRPDIIVLEEYRIYAQKLAEHTNSNVPTLRLIGGIEMLSYLYEVPIIKQGAGKAKAFCTDNKLAAWDLLDPENRHATDAIRHGVYFLVFGGQTHDPLSDRRVDPLDSCIARLG